MQSIAWIEAYEEWYKVRFSMELDESRVKKTKPSWTLPNIKLKNTVLKHSSAGWWDPSNFTELSERHLVQIMSLSDISF